MLPVFISMCLFTLLGSISPGPVNLIAASRGASAGFFRAMPHVLGASVSYVCIVWLVGSGLNLVFLANPAIGQALQLVGAAYLLYLAAKIAMAPPATRQEGGAGRGLRRSDARGVDPEPEPQGLDVCLLRCQPVCHRGPSWNTGVAGVLRHFRGGVFCIGGHLGRAGHTDRAVAVYGQEPAGV